MKGDYWGAGKPKKPIRARYPLRKVVGEERFYAERGLPSVVHDVLECGHTLPVAKDISGRRFPDMRRCWKCGAKKQLRGEL